jgi:hypothetical protein
MTKRWLALIFFGSLWQGSLSAAESVQSAAGFAFPSAQEGGGARAIALGSTYVGIAEGSASLLWNPAGLGNLNCPELALHHDSELVGAFQEIAVLGMPLGNGNGLGVSLNYEDLGSFQGRDASGAATGTYGDQLYGASLGWGMAVPGGLSLGVAIKANQEQLAGSSTSAFAGDLGLLWSPVSCVSLGAAYTNLGPAVDGEMLAQGLRLGVSSYIAKGSDFQWLLAMSGETLTQGADSLHFGLESTMHQFLALRAGYSFEFTNGNTSTDTTNMLGWTFGGGILLNDFCLDYAFVPMSDLGNTQRVSLTYKFSAGCISCPPVAPAPAEHSALPVEPKVEAVAPASKNLVILLSDKDFTRVVPHGEEEALSPDAIIQLHGALAQVSGVAGASIVVNGNTALMLHPYGTKNGQELREIGDRRSKLVSEYFQRKMPGAKLSSIVEDGTAEGTPVRIFQVALR